MPLYLCNSVRGAIPEDAKQKIASDITDIHCDITGTSSAFVHVFFFEDAPELPIHGKTVFLFGNILAGHTSDQKEELIGRIKQAIHVRAGLPIGEVVVDTTDIPANWVMEGADVLSGPAPEQLRWRNHGATTKMKTCAKTTRIRSYEKQ